MTNTMRIPHLQPRISSCRTQPKIFVILSEAKDPCISLLLFPGIVNDALHTHVDVAPGAR
jgi:hypothetical protein